MVPTMLGATGVMPRLLDEDDGARLQDLCEACAAFTEEVTGLPPGPAEAQSLFIAIPPHGDYSRKRLWGLFLADRLAGVIDAAFGHPTENDFWLGLLMLTPQMRRRGIGGAAVRFLIAYGRAAEARTLSLAVKADDAAAQAFWAAQGLRRVRATELKMAGYGPTSFDVLEMPIA